MLSKIQGTIDRRLLVNFSADPEVVQKLLPKPFRPQVVRGRAVVGICLIRFSGLRPQCFPFGIRSENAAHRIAVEWAGAKGVECGVYIVRRDTSSWLKTFLGGWMFAGVYHRADFCFVEEGSRYEVAFESRDSSARVRVSGDVWGDTPTNGGAGADRWPRSSVFSSLEEASQFFKNGSTGFSPGGDGTPEGMRLVTDHWNVNLFEAQTVQSSFFEDEKKFPKGTLQYDHTLIMRHIPHYWEKV